MEIETGFTITAGYKPSIDGGGYVAQIGFNRRLVWEGSRLHVRTLDAEIEAEERLHGRLKGLFA